MYTVDITGSTGVEAEFVVGSPVLALDLVLRAVRAGFAWKALDAHSGPLSLARLREIAVACASRDEAEARCLQQVVIAEGRAAAVLNN